MNPDQMKRAVSAVDEEMSIEDTESGSFLVKGEYVVDPRVPECTCPDFEYREKTCKHVVRVVLEIVFGNIDPLSD